jgi:hypothetical protein
VKCDAFTSVTLKVTVVWDLTPGTLIDVYTQFDCQMEAMNDYQTAGSDIRRGSNLHTIYSLSPSVAQV